MTIAVTSSSTELGTSRRAAGSDDVVCIGDRSLQEGKRDMIIEHRHDVASD
jgi:hypothetical protein